ncbi:MAG: DUF4249 domain-containing protein [Bacteroidales bacterium]|nr:DUF4249 domain-containing protein [Bacteroidales bacterium]
MSKFTKYILFVAWVTFVACTNELPYDQLEREPRLIMNALINADAEAQELSLFLTGRDRSMPLQQGATLAISVNGQRRYTLRSDNDAMGKSKFVFDADFNSGDRVRFDVNTDDGKYHAWAEVVVPEMPQAASDFREQRAAPLSSYGSNLVTRYNFTIHDDPTVRNYYRLSAGYIKEYYMANADTSTMAIRPWSHVFRSAHYAYNSREDMALSDGLPTPRQEENDEIGLVGMSNITGVFDDTYFIGGRYMMSIYQERQSNLYQVMPDSVAELAEIAIEAISEDYYHYLRALNIFDSDMYTEELSQPIVFPSNVQGGTGMVTIFKRKEVCFPLQRYL